MSTFSKREINWYTTSYNSLGSIFTTYDRIKFYVILFLLDLTTQDSGLYTCQAKSRSGQAVWSASLEVADPNLDPSVTFNSMPYLSQFPASPSKPQLVNATATSITLSWDKPHRIGGSALQGYQVCVEIPNPVEPWGPRHPPGTLPHGGVWGMVYWYDVWK